MNARRQTGLAVAACLGVALLMMAPITTAPGWPHNHEFAAPFERVEAMRRAFAAWDFFPTWTPFCFNGHGSPGPLIYHRLFNWVAALLSLVLGTSQGVRVALIGFAWLGGVGLVRSARRLGLGWVMSVMLAAIYVWSPYSLIDWLVRGSFAEFALMMVVPWLLEALLRQLQGERAWRSIGVWLGLTLHAHQSIGLYLCLLPVAAAVLTFLVARGRRLQVLLDSLKAAALAGAIVLPWLLAIQVVGPFFRIDVLKMYVPWGQYVPWARYVADDTFPWGATFQGFSVELSRWLLEVLVGVVALALLVGARLTRRLELVFLGLALGFATYLQLEQSASLYQAVPRAELLQFPWRLLALATPVAILILGVLVDAVRPRAARALALAAAAWVAWKHFELVKRAEDVKYRGYTQPELTKILTELDGPFSAAEYLPKTLAQTPERTDWVRSEGCVIKRVTPAQPEHFKRLEIEVEPSATPCRLLFSQFDTPMLDVEGDGTRVAGATFLTIEVSSGGRSVALRKRSLPELWRTR